MSDRYLLTFLHDDESVLLLLRPAFLMHSPAVVLLTFIFFLDIFFYFPLQRFDMIGVAVFWSVFVVTILRGLYQYFLWRRNVCVVTNRRIIDIDRPSLFTKQVSEVTLEQIQDIRYNQKGVIQTIANIGTLTLDLGSQRGRIELPSIRQPHSVKEQLMRLHRQHTKEEEPSTEEEIDEL